MAEENKEIQEPQTSENTKEKVEEIKEDTANETSENNDETSEANANEETVVEDKKDSEDIPTEFSYTKEGTEEVSKALDKKGVDFSNLVDEFQTTGAISEATRARLAEVGIPNEVVDNYIEGAKARAEVEYNEMSQCVGGREKFNTILKWAADNLSPQEIKSINAVTDRFQIENILIGLKNRMEEKEGVMPEYQKGEGSQTPAVEGFRSQAEMFEAIKDPKYNKDEAYRRDVLKKITASREAGIDLGIY